MANKVLRIKLHQNQANYKKEETVENKMTYPLPPFSTIIGAIHNACGYTTYHPMKISVQGSYEAMQKEPYRDLAFLNSLQDDRGKLVKLKNPTMYNDGYTIIAESLKNQGNSFKNNITISIKNKKEYDKYIEIANLKDEYNDKSKLFKEEIKAEKNKLKEIKNQLKTKEKGSEEYENLSKEVKELNNDIKKREKKFKQEREEKVEIPISYYATLTTSIKYYEVLYGVDLVIHIDSDEETIEDIQNNIMNLTSIGRSEDFVDNVKIDLVKVYDDKESIQKLKSPDMKYAGYIDKSLVIQNLVKYKSSTKEVQGVKTTGTTYYLNKDYKIIDNKRIFNKKKVVYITDCKINSLKVGIEKYNLENESKIYLDQDGYLVNLI